MIKTKTILTIIFLFGINLTFAQEIFGKYHDYFGSSIELKSDSTFKYRFRFDLISSWTVGTWISRNDTIIFKNKPVYDTIINFEIQGKKIYELVLSMDEKAERITNEGSVLDQITSGGQNGLNMPVKLYFNKERLYDIDKNGKLFKKKRKWMTSKKYVPWYVKE